MASSFLVIKVTYGDTLRRFTANLDGDQQLDLDIGRLRAKIRCLFNFAPDAVLMLTYIDEDHDVVALVDDEDILDVVRQALNPVRINVQLNTGKMNPPPIQSSATYNPHRSQVNNSSPDINSGLADLLQSMPEPLRQTLAKMSLEMASKAVSSASALAELIDRFSKMGQSVSNSQPQSQSAPTDSTACKEAGESDVESSAGKDNSPTKDGVIKVNKSFPASDSTQQPYFGKETLSSSFPNGYSAEDCSFPCKLHSGDGRKKIQDINDDSGRKFSDNRYSGCCALSGEGTSGGVALYPRSIATSAECDSVGKGTATDSAVTKEHTPSVFSCPELSQQNASKKYNSFARPNIPKILSTLIPRAQHLSRSINPVDNLGNLGTVFHRGVRCDGCGVLPITGPRFKSKVKDDYDLCQICFARMGNDSDYVRIDFPALHRHPWSFKGYSDDLIPFAGRSMRNLQPRLDSRLIKDVNVIDGTIMAPKTRFTKFWRMCNSGTLPWTHGTQLIWIGGENFADTRSVEIEIPSNGLGVEEELDVAVDFVAPELPGLHFSYWRMASPFGQMFGQRVWVLIQVLDASLKDRAPGATQTQMQSLNLNMPPLNANESSPSPVPISKDNITPSVVEGRGQKKFPVSNFLPHVLYYSSEPSSLGLQPPGASQTQTQSLNLNMPPVNANKPSPPPLMLISEDNIMPSVVEGQGQNNFQLPRLLNCPSQPSSLGPQPPAFSHTTTSQPISLESKIPILSPANSWEVSCPTTEADVFGLTTIQASSSSTDSSQPLMDVSIHSAISAAPSFQAAEEEAERSYIKWGNDHNGEDEEALVNELVEMGFGNVHLNKEVLRKNNYNLDKSLDDLCGYADWDLLLEELRRMGFSDQEMNKGVLVKNNGSLKHAVMDLIAREHC